MKLIHRSRWAALFGAGVLLLTGLNSAQATLTPGTLNAFDGNLTVEGGEIDWANVGVTCPTTIPATTSTCSLDLLQGQGDNAFGNGTKEDTAVPSVVDDSIPPNKSDLTRFYVQFATVSGNDYVYLAWERIQNPSGTTNMDFELNQSKVLSANGQTPVRTTGDILITYDLASGGTHPSLGYRVWSGSQWGSVNALSGSVAEGSVNTGTTTDPIAPNAGRSLDPYTFGEAAVNLTAAKIVGSDPCFPFASAYLKSRSSDSFTSALKDFVAPVPINFSHCGTVRVHKQDDDNPNANLAGAGFTLYVDAAPTGGTRGTEDTTVQATCTTDTTGNCSFGNKIPAGNYWIVETTVPTGYTAAPDQAITVTANSDNTYTFTDVRQFKVIVLVCKDVRQFKVIVLVCKDADNSLYASSVTLGSDTKTSLGSAPSGVTAAQLCALGGASFDPLSTGTYNGSVTIPQ